METAHQTSARTGGDQIVKSVARTCQTLVYFDEVQRPLSVVEVSKELGYPQSSTSALLKSLVKLGFLTHDARKKSYFPTERVPLLGSWMNPDLFGEGTIHRLLKAISERTRHVVVLATKNGDEAEYVQVVRPKDSPIHHISLGTRRPLGNSGVGRVLMSRFSDDEVRSLFRRINAYRAPDKPAVDVKAFVASLAETRAKGYYLSTDQVVQGSGLISMPFPNHLNSRLFAVGVGAPTDVILRSEKEIVGIMHEEIVRNLKKMGQQSLTA
ncbi:MULTISPECIES: IclR family transcriptional regulator [Rhodobacterales]|jgi:DNA-binding IclR family transcriptional regulator|uniref:Transcriptional regulator, IclR family n=4 Tax=Rhodobacterales TaxID=204455 RepID=A0A1I7ABR1_9RHOB|nr:MULTISPECIES: IclR family transcriptional regulator C-terminal domain-containing protein [Rhodobacterales]MBL3704920.1 helix-turn-helix domain-containing protein [Sulfitobacter sp. BDSS02]MBR9851790.1 helix-turn-helix domain-containing protein [Paracoccaceae bacterium]MEC7258397.1 IclR family transcriptional regulator C-terminal domain-containing protein [Pseudomonadota bacterium]APE46118.1 transcriptional regulator [Sulfitobacter alexandrii]AUC56419.1 transcriptional regulator [Sagittula s|tara:strand:- start:815 stop:1618 length:804 start_codon:yes stop_codon:yes gene_type:complete